MIDQEKIRRIVAEYRKSQIQSEAEVRSKLLVPLIEALGYPSELRSEEFPVYSRHGRKQLPITHADFLLFSDSRFGSYRKNTDENKAWVKNHSLLVCEAKKPGEMKDDSGQAEFYALWTGCPAYIMCDGDTFRAFYNNPLSAEKKIIDCRTDILYENADLNLFSYAYLMEVKDSAVRFSAEKSDFQVVKPEDVDLPAEVVEGMRHALNLPANLSDYDVLSTFLNTTDAYLERGLRYSIPKYMLGIPRDTYDATIYVDLDCFSSFSGSVIHYFRDQVDIYAFYNECVDLQINCVNSKIVGYFLTYHVQCSDAKERESILKKVRRVFRAETILLKIEGLCDKEIHTSDYTNAQDSSSSLELYRIDYWIDEMRKIQEIENKYGIMIELKPFDDFESSIKLYEAVDNVYRGLIRERNCTVFFPPNKDASEDIEIDEIIPFGSGDISLPTLSIHGVLFYPKESYILPTTIKMSFWKNNTIEVPACCVYGVEDKVVESRN